jgi:hypothetical protein
MNRATLFTVLALACATGQAADTFYACTKVDGTVFYRRGGCPTTAAVPVVTPSGGVGTAVGGVQQQSIGDDAACDGAKAKLERAQEMSARSGRPLPYEFVASSQRNIAAMCR